VSGGSRYFGYRDAGSIVLLLIGMANGALVFIAAEVLGIDREIALDVSAPVSACLITAAITRVAFSRMHGFTVAVLTMCDTYGSTALLLASVLLPDGTIPLTVKLAWLGHVVGWLIGYITKMERERPRLAQLADVDGWRRQGGLRDRIEESFYALNSRAAELELRGKAQSKERTCPGCKHGMTFAGFVIANVRDRPFDQLAKIWLDDRVQLRCCACYDESLLASEPYLTDAAGNRVGAPTGPTYPYHVGWWAVALWLFALLGGMFYLLTLLLTFPGAFTLIIVTSTVLSTVALVIYKTYIEKGIGENEERNGEQN
jgi:uncharacterized membrane protein (UPF0136 family)